MWKKFQNNPYGKRVGDCVVRAVSKATGMDWGQTYTQLAVQGYLMGDMPSSNAVWGAYLKSYGFLRETIPNTCPDCYTAEDFCKDHPRGVYVLGFGNHVATVIDGVIYDSWDSSKEIPVYYFYKEE